MDSAGLQARLETLPDQPGVYFFKDAGGKTLYIGKALSLRKRVAQYFQGQDNRPNIALMRDKLQALDFIATDTETEALILEANLIHTEKPRYNILLKDGKHFPYFKITVNEPFPRLLIVRKLFNDGARYFGPYTDVRMLRRTFDFLRDTFQLRRCDHALPSPKPLRPCLYSQLNRCTGPCGKKVTEEEYRHRVDQALAVLNGRSRSLAKILREQMENASLHEEYETAALLRDRMTAIETIIERQKMDDCDITVSRDVIALEMRGEEGCAVVLRIREGLVLQKQHYFLRGSSLEGEGQTLSSFMRQFYLEQSEFPAEIFIGIALEDAQAVEEWLAGKRGARVKLLTPQRGEKVRLLELARKNAALLLLEEMGRKELSKGEAHPSLEALARHLALPRLPRRIECFDIAHLQGSETVASQIVFVDHEPRKRDYRHYKIESVTGPDDTASMTEVLQRRIRHRNESPLPDLILLDGGKGQLSAGMRVLQEMLVPDQPMAALAKRLDEVFIPGRADSIQLPKNSPALRLLQRLRNEAHRFANTYHQKRRAIRTLTSELDAIPGIGPKKRTALLQRFGSIAQIQGAVFQSLVETVGTSAAQKIQEYLSSQNGTHGK